MLASVAALASCAEPASMETAVFLSIPTSSEDMASPMHDAGSMTATQQWIPRKLTARGKGSVRLQQRPDSPGKTAPQTFLGRWLLVSTWEQYR